MKNKIQIIVYLVSLFIISCSSIKKTEIVGEKNKNSLYGQWEAKSLIKNLENGESNVVVLDALGQRPDKIRMEVTSTLGFALATVIINRDNIEYLLPRQKKYFYGAISDTSLKPVLKVNINPKILLGLFFEEPQAGWNCKSDKELLTSCSIDKENVHIVWERENGNPPRVIVEGNKFNIQIQIKKYSDKAELSSNTMSLKVPDSFKRIPL